MMMKKMMIIIIKVCRQYYEFLLSMTHGKLSIYLAIYQVEIQCFPSPKLFAITRLKSPVCCIIYLKLEEESFFA